MLTKTKKRIQILIISLLALFVTSWVEILLQKNQNYIGAGINRTFLFLLINLHVIIIVALLYLIVRQTIQIFVEIHRKSPGINFKKNIFFVLTIFSVIPSFFVFFIAGTLINKSIDSWFSTRINTGFQNALVLHEHQTEELRLKIKKLGQNLYQELNSKNLSNKINTKNTYTPLAISKQNIKVYIWTQTGKEILGSIYDEINIWRSFRQLNDRSTHILKKKFFQIIYNKPEQEKLFDFYGSLYYVKELEQSKNFFVLTYRYPENIRYPLIKLENSIYDYEQLKSMQNPIYRSYFLTFILVTLLILFLSIWCAFYLARGISKPIQELLSATSKIESGNWNINVSTDDQSGDLKTLSIAFNNMTKAVKKAQDKLEEQNQEMLMVLENIKEAFFFIDKTGRILMHNSASKYLVKNFLNLENFKNKKINFFGPIVKNKFFTLVKELKYSGKKQLTQEITFSFNSEQKTLLVSLNLISSSFINNNENILLVIIEDLTDIVKINKLKTWQQAADQIAHEIKNPLTPIQLATQRLQRKFSSKLNNQSDIDTNIQDKIFHDCTNTILEHVQIIKDLITHFAEFAKLPSGNIEPLNLNNIITEEISLYKLSYPEINFNLDLQENLPLIKMDRKKLERALVNLLENSVRVLNNASKIIEIKTSFLSQTNQIEILFKDNGPGINSNVKNKIFLPYISTEKKNMGLGLSIVHEIFTQAGGSIKLLPSKQGAFFQILLPG